MSRPDIGAAMQWQLQAAGLPIGVLEFQFHPSRRWRFDLAWPEKLLAMEIDGGAFVQGRHTSGAGFLKDIEKASEAAILGWRILRVTPRQVDNGQALALAERALGELLKTMVAAPPQRLCQMPGCMTILPAGVSICQFHQHQMET